MDRLDTIIEIAADVLNVKKELLTGDTKLEEAPEWDSLNHLRLVASIEERLNVVIPFEKVADIKSLRDFLNF